MHFCRVQNSRRKELVNADCTVSKFDPCFFSGKLQEVTVKVFCLFTGMIFYAGDEEFVKRVVGMLKATFDIGKEKIALPFGYLGLYIARTDNSVIIIVQTPHVSNIRVAGCRNINAKVSKRNSGFLLANVKSCFQKANNSFNELLVTNVRKIIHLNSQAPPGFFQKKKRRSNLDTVQSVFTSSFGRVLNPAKMQLTHQVHKLSTCGVMQARSSILFLLLSRYSSLIHI